MTAKTMTSIGSYVFSYVASLGRLVLSPSYAASCSWVARADCRRLVSRDPWFESRPNRCKYVRSTSGIET